MKVEKIDAREVFKDDNEGLIFGLQEVNDYGDLGYCEWFATEEERNDCIRKHDMEVVS
jgi:hypothetical protein